MKTRYVTEMGMGTDVHGCDQTVAAERAVFDAIHHSSLHFFASMDKTPHDMFIEVLIGAPEPDQVDTARVARALPYGTVTVRVEKGGLQIPADDGKDDIVIANAGIIVRMA